MALQNAAKSIAAELELPLKHVLKALEMIAQGDTIPYMARYRSHLFGHIDLENLRSIERLYEEFVALLEYKESLFAKLRKKPLVPQEVFDAIAKAQTAAEAQSYYAPFQTAKTSRYSEAIKAGLAPLAQKIALGDMSYEALKKYAASYIGKGAKSPREAIEMALDIKAFEFASTPAHKAALKGAIWRYGRVRSKAKKSFDPQGVYHLYGDFSQSLHTIPSYRLLAMMRGQKQKELTVGIEFDADIYIQKSLRPYRKNRLLFSAYEDGIKRLMLPSVKKQILGELLEQAQTKALQLFEQNLAQMLLTPPVHASRVLGVDPGFKSGCKLAVVDNQGRLIEYSVIYLDEAGYSKALETARRLIELHGVECVAIGNATGSYEAQQFFDRYNQTFKPIPFSVVSESGASVYSVSQLAAKEYQGVEIWAIGAAAIALRLIDPLSLLVKIDPKSLGVGQYQHDMPPKRLDSHLKRKVEDVVNSVGVEINQASSSLLSYLSGLSETDAETIVEFRQSHGPFRCKKDLLKVPGVGPKRFRQCAGFVRIKNSDHWLENSGVHPDYYPLAMALKEQDDIPIEQLMEQYNVSKEEIDMVLEDIKKPSFDPRDEIEPVHFLHSVGSIENLELGMAVEGVVRSVVEFGAFVDIGLKQSALLHRSAIGPRGVEYPQEHLSINQRLSNLEVIKIDREKGQIGIKMTI